APLPGVAVMLDSTEVPSATVYTQANGNYRFALLPAGSAAYTLTFSLEGFQTVVQENVDVRLGLNSQIDVTMALSSVEETVTVTGASPIVDVKKTGTGTNLSEEYMQSIPSARDPWVMMQQTAGLQVSQENIGGSESGQQSGFSRGGADRGSDNMWTYDGAEMTDMSATGASPMYYDFDAFEEISVSTGGNDPSVQSGGIKINFVTKRGGNEWRGSGRFYLTEGDWQSRNVGDPDTGELIGDFTAEQLIPGYIGDSINNIKDFGGELGGPLVNDRVFVWGAYGKQDIKQNVGISPDNTQLKNIHGKANFHLGDNMVANYTFLDAGKTKQGRGASSRRPPATTWNQGGNCCIHTGKVQYTIDDNNYVEALYNFNNLGFFLEPQGGRDVTVSYDLGTGIWGDSYYFYDTKRPLKNARLDANTYKAGADVDHEFKYGYSWRNAETNSISGAANSSVAFFLEGVPYAARLVGNAFDNYKNVR
ncbi:MAG: TonB-dependent receptor, partial [Acidimicrobiia bacterium]|nr:TonB-dependent receptor [Acidimicrobiia bacterium]